MLRQPNSASEIIVAYTRSDERGRRRTSSVDLRQLYSEWKLFMITITSLSDDEKLIGIKSLFSIHLYNGLFMLFSKERSLEINNY
jgi:hypothetical protein